MVLSTFSLSIPERDFSVGSFCLRNLLFLGRMESLMTWSGTLIRRSRGNSLMKSFRTQLGILWVEGLR